MFWNRVRQAIYAVSTVAGLVWPGYFLVQFITATKDEAASAAFQAFDLPTFIEQVWANAASSFVAADLTIVLLLAIIFMVTESRRLKLRFWGIYVVLIFLISFAFGFSLFMFVRERKLAASLEPAETQSEALSV
ncbi:MAG: DUF2834 domain-containing protein [Cyanobacteria bacterium P01_D01_bin.71]